MNKQVDRHFFGEWMIVLTKATERQVGVSVEGLVEIRDQKSVMIHICSSFLCWPRPYSLSMNTIVIIGNTAVKVSAEYFKRERVQMVDVKSKLGREGRTGLGWGWRRSDGLKVQEISVGSDLSVVWMIIVVGSRKHKGQEDMESRTFVNNLQLEDILEKDNNFNFYTYKSTKL